MRKFIVKNLIEQLATKKPVPYRPFPGKIPTRLFIKISVYGASIGRNRTRFSYHGKFNSSVLLKMYNTWQKMVKTEMVSCFIMEYHQGGIVLAGDFQTASVYPYHSLAHFRSPHYGVGTSQWSIARPVEEMVINVAGRKVFIPKADFPADEVERRRYRGQVRSAIYRREIGKGA